MVHSDENVGWDIGDCYTILFFNFTSSNLKILNPKNFIYKFSI